MTDVTILGMPLPSGATQGQGRQIPGAAVAALLVGFPLAAQTAPSWEELEARQARIAAVDLRIGDVFDLANPHENHWIGRLANTLHLQTREQVVRRELLFAPGDVVNVRLIRESERNLRTFRFLKDAWIEPQVDRAGTVHAVVHTQDAWTLKGSVGFTQVGGQRDFGFSLHEGNFLGFGKDLTLAHERTPERSINTVHYLDRQLLGTQWTLESRYQSLSDGKTRFLEVARPYRALDTPWSMIFRASSSDAIQSVYNLERAAYAFPSRQAGALVEGSVAMDPVDGQVLRMGGGLDLRQSEYGPIRTLDPAGLPLPQLRDRHLWGLHATWSLFQDRFRTFRDLAGMTHAEDYNLGWEATVNLGTHLKRLGSDVNSPFLLLRASKGWTPWASSLLLARGRAEGRHESGGWQDAMLNLSLTAYYQGFRAQTQAAYLQVDVVLRPEPENHLYLGGFEGLRGYGNHLLLGDRRWMASLEERINTSYDWLGILRLGFVVYADAGAIRRADTGAWSRTYVDVGGGLRFGNLKSATGRVFLLTVAYPLVRDPGTEHHQFIITDVVKF
ncbi:hypothetical protein [Geothrix fermentans]|uniref:hypothetical protein n=1 Tax=Geothrix fermentans TaxID=44676 RepID=UPI000410C649|nr:hypothetical protein [Geothrix fermentans]